jgi:putative CocE/NonD family hydrolase
MLAAALSLAPAATAVAAWQPEPATYGIGQATYTIAGVGGTPLRVRVYYPTDPATGAEAAGDFPVLLTQTPYTDLSDSGASTLGAAGAALVGYNPYFVQRGYIMASMDVRGTGQSGGTFALFDPIEGQDGAIAARWAAELPHSSGEVGLAGGSYMGIDQFPTAVDAGPGSPIKAMFPIVSATDVYRDEATAGGVPSIEFNLPYTAGLVPGVSLLSDVFTGGPTLLQQLTAQLQGLTTDSLPMITNIATGGDEAFDGPFWQQRSPDSYIQQIVADGIPAFMVGGWFDLFQRGEPLNYSGFQNAYRGRPVLAPMLPHQRVTPRYQVLMEPTYHVTTGELEYRGLNLNELELAWFDYWLKGVQTGITDTTTPAHLYDLGTGSYREAATYPLGQAQPTTYYFHAGGGLSTTPPTESGGSDPVVFTGTSVPCSTSIDQWSAGFGQLLFNALNTQDPCTQDSALSETGPGAVTYTSAPFTAPTTLGGPIGATIYATANTTDTLWVVSIDDVAPNGQPRQLTSGVLDGQLRALDTTNSWFGSDGRPILPYHPYTHASLQPVTPGALTRYDVEVFPTFDTLEPGHRLRVVINTDDFPHIFPDTTEFANMIGGVWQVQRNASAPSGVEVPLASPASFTPPSGGLFCGRATGRLAGRALGPVRLGETRGKARLAFLRRAVRGVRRDWDFFCLQGPGIHAWYPSPKLLRKLSASERRQLRGRVAVLLTANRHYALDGVRAGTRLSPAARRLHLHGPFNVRGISWYFAAGRSSDGVLKVRRGRVEEVGIALKSLISAGPTVWAYFTTPG